MFDRILDFHPSKKNPGMTVYDYLDTFMWTITFGSLRFDLKMWWCKKYGKKIPAYSTVFKKQGVVLQNGWFVPDDNSFGYGNDPNLMDLV